MHNESDEIKSKILKHASKKDQEVLQIFDKFKQRL